MLDGILTSHTMIPKWSILIFDGQGESVVACFIRRNGSHNPIADAEISPNPVRWSCLMTYAHLG